MCSLKGVSAITSPGSTAPFVFLKASAVSKYLTAARLGPKPIAWDHCVVVESERNLNEKTGAPGMLARLFCSGRAGGSGFPNSFNASHRLDLPLPFVPKISVRRLGKESINVGWIALKWEKLESSSRASVLAVGAGNGGEGGVVSPV